MVERSIIRFLKYNRSGVQTHMSHKAGTRKDGLKSFLIRHERLMSAIGGLLVFLTFITWEAVRDHLKDIDSELDSIVTRHQITAEATAIIRNLQLAEGRTDRSFKINTEKNGLGPVGFMSYLDIETLKATQQDTDRSEEVISSDFEYNITLLKKLPSHAGGAAREQEGRVASDLKACKVSDAALATSMKSYIPPPIGAPNALADSFTNPQYHKLAERVKAVTSALNTAQGDENLFSESTLKSVEKEKDDAEGWQRFATIAGICLYTLGWALAFVGKVVGINGAETEVG
jgi:hypothetical protein